MFEDTIPKVKSTKTIRFCRSLNMGLENKNYNVTIKPQSKELPLAGIAEHEQTYCVHIQKNIFIAHLLYLSSFLQLDKMYTYLFIFFFLCSKFFYLIRLKCLPHNEPI